jgi:hypothetical protein
MPTVDGPQGILYDRSRTSEKTTDPQASREGVYVDEIDTMPMKCSFTSSLPPCYLVLDYVLWLCFVVALHSYGDLKSNRFSRILPNVFHTGIYFFFFLSLSLIIMVIHGAAEFV